MKGAFNLSMAMNRENTEITLVQEYLRDLQLTICKELEAEDGEGEFKEDVWSFAGGGGGKSRVLTNGRVFEKAGVNYSSICGEQLPAAATAKRGALAEQPFTATGVSLVVHPLNPYVPTTHMNLRYIQVGDEKWWFGGGFDLTPYYGFEEDAVHWHRQAHKACDGFGESRYARYKQWCDDYFFLKHRNETRGIGGLFFDDLDEQDFDYSFRFVRNVGDHFLPAYMPIVQRRKETPYKERERDFQLYRRGRYVEFNLVYDRGTLFGLQSGGRTESILMSLPPLVAWQYDWKPEKNTPEWDLYEHFLKPRDWLRLGQ